MKFGSSIFEERRDPWRADTLADRTVHVSEIAIFRRIRFRIEAVNVFEVRRGCV